MQYPFLPKESRDTIQTRAMGNKEVHIFPKIISSKVNVIVQL